jgi:cytochrome c553
MRGHAILRGVVRCATPQGVALPMAPRRAGVAAVALLVAAASPATAADAALGKAKAAACSACHGPQGIAVAPDAPNLAGQPAMYLGAQLRAYKSGKRRHEVMTLMAKPLSEADIDNLAAWFSSIAVEAKAP